MVLSEDSNNIDLTLKKKSTFLKRLWRLLVIFLISFCVLFTIAAIVFYFYFTPARIEKFAEDIISKNVPGQFDFENSRFNLLNGFTLDNISFISYQDSNNLDQSFPVQSFTAKKAVLKYNLWSLLKRQVTIAEIEIDSPDIEIVQAKKRELRQTDYIMQSGPLPSAPLQILTPLSIVLKKFKIKNATIHFSTIDSTLNYQFYINQIYFDINNLNIPRGNLFTQDSLINGQIRLKCENTLVKLNQQNEKEGKEIEVSTVVDGYSRLGINSLKDIVLSLNFSIKNITAHLPGNLYSASNSIPYPVELNVNSQLNLMDSSVVFDPVALKINKTPWFAVYVTVNNLIDSTNFALHVTKSLIPIQDLYDIVFPFIPDSLKTDIYFHNKNTVLSFAGTTISGAVADSTELYLKTKVTLRDFGTTINKGQYFVQGLGLSAVAGLNLIKEEINDPFVDVFFSFDSLSVKDVAPQDINVGASRLQFNSQLNSNFLPQKIKGMIKISNFWDSQITGDVSIASEKSMKELLGNIQLAVDNLNCGEIAGEYLETTASLALNLSFDTLDNIKAFLTLNTDSMQVKQNSETISFPPLSVESNICTQTDSLFKEWTIDSINIKCKGLFESFMTGFISLNDPKIYNISLPHFKLYHSDIFEWIPDNFKKGIENIKISGVTNLSAQVETQMSLQDTSMKAFAHLLTQNTNIYYPAQDIALTGLTLDLSSNFDKSDGLALSGFLNIDSTVTSRLLNSVFTQNSLNFHLFSKDFRSIHLDSFFLKLPDLYTYGKMTADVSNLDSTPFVDASLDFFQEAADTISITEDISFVGKNQLLATVKTDSSITTIDAQFKTKDLSLFLPQDILIENVNTDLALFQKINLDSTILLGSDYSPVKTPVFSNLEYFLYDDYYKNSEQNNGYIKIKKIKAQGYEIDNVAIQAFLGNGRLEMPFINMDLYGGNIAGRFSLDASDKKIDQITFKLMAHFAGINSSLLLPENVKRKTQGLITAHTELTGKGFDINKGIDLDGFFYITKIESKVADNLLRSLDPEGQDSGIRSTRFLLNRGFKPRLFSFEIKHGYCYPAVYFDQPWYFPLRLSGGNIELARIPVAFFLNAQK